MEWTYTLTLILTMVGSMVAVWYAFYQIIKSDEQFAEQRKGSCRKKIAYGLNSLKKSIPSS